MLDVRQPGRQAAGKPDNGREAEVAALPVPVAYGYLRVSTGDQADSLEAQQDEVMRFFRYALEPKGYTWGGVYRDEDVSGGSKFSSRPEGGKLSSVLEAGDAVIFSKLDRGFRNTVDCLQTIESFQKRKIRVSLLDVRVEDTGSATGHLIVGVIALIAEWERRRIIERIKDTMPIRKRAGRAVSGVPPYGFRKIRKTVEGKTGSYIVPNEQERTIGSAIVQFRDRDKWGFEAISRHLNSHQIPSRQGKWTPRKVRIAYLGELQLRVNEAAESGKSP